MFQPKAVYITATAMFDGVLWLAVIEKYRGMKITKKTTHLLPTRDLGEFRFARQRHAFAASCMKSSSLGKLSLISSSSHW